MLPTPAPRHPGGGDLLSSVACTSSTGCLAVGQIQVLRSGISIQHTFSESSIGGISCPAAGACMSVGYSTDPTGESSFNLAEAWNGTRWSVVKTPHP